jgi:hypothetical protein
MPNFRSILIISMVFVFKYIEAQDTTQTPAWNMTATSDPIWYAKSSFTFTPSLDETINHYPSHDDSSLVEKHKDLISSHPHKKNYHLYKTVACALWDIGNIADAEKMFLEIYHSKAKYYAQQYYYGSDIPGDKSKNSYGYGSFVSNYKHYACRYLCEIAIEREQFDTALKYLIQADTVYPLTYNCGTGYNRYREQMDGLYSMCYKGLGQKQLLIDLFLPVCFDTYSKNLIWALKQTYSKNHIDSVLLAAEHSIICILDSTTSYYTTYENYGKKDQKEIKTTFTSGTGTIELFGLTFTLPEPDLRQDEVVTRAHYIALFKESALYQSLSH